MRPFHLQIITPETIIYDGQVTQVQLPAVAGVEGILAYHLPYLAPLKADELVVYPTDRRGPEDSLSFAIDFGLAEFANNRLLILVAAAAAAADIDLNLAQQAKKRAQQLMAQKVSTEDYTSALALLERETAKIKVASKYRLKHRVN